jgi:hypothetical protein
MRRTHQGAAEGGLLDYADPGFEQAPPAKEVEAKKKILSSLAATGQVRPYALNFQLPLCVTRPGSGASYLLRNPFARLVLGCLTRGTI